MVPITLLPSVQKVMLHVTSPPPSKSRAAPENNKHFCASPNNMLHCVHIMYLCLWWFRRTWTVFSLPTLPFGCDWLVELLCCCSKHMTLGWSKKSAGLTEEIEEGTLCSSDAACIWFLPGCGSGILSADHPILTALTLWSTLANSSWSTSPPPAMRHT
jgi:hypothetical protein